jgi:hexosaminidase
MWTEFVSSERQMHQLVFPRLCAFAEAVWRSDAADEAAFDDFEARLVAHSERLHALDVDGFSA